MPDVPPPPRIIFFAEGSTLTHAVRPAVLAKWAAEAGYQVFFATGYNYSKFIDAELAGTNVTRISIYTQNSTMFLKQLACGKSIQDPPDVIAAVEEDIRVLRETAPDLIIGDMRLSLGISARLCHIPYAEWLDPGLSRYTKQHFVLPCHPLRRVLPVPVFQAIFDIIRPFVFYLHSRGYNSVRKHFGLKPIKPHLFEVYADADMLLYPDVEAINPAHDLPAHHHYIGPVPWSPKMAKPDWWDKLRTDVPIVYVNLGSSGPAKLLPAILRSIAELPVQVMAGTSGQHVDIGTLPDNVLGADYLPGDECMARASIIINSGSPTAYYHAFRVSEAPILGIPDHMASHLGMQILTRAGAGVIMLPSKVTPCRIKDTVAAMLVDKNMHAAARNIAAALRQVDTKRNFFAFLDKTLHQNDTLAL